MQEVVVESRFFPLLVTLVGFIFVVYPVFVSYGQPGILLNVFALCMFAVSLRAAAGGHRMVPLILWLAVFMFATRVWTYFDDSSTILIAHIGLSALFQVVIALVCLSRVFDSSPVTSDKILGAICVYLLVGVVFSYCYEITYILDRDSFDLGGAELKDPKGTLELWVFFYFSFVTLTTLGYGDVLPLTAFSRSLATLEAVVGPLYLAVLVARLVSLRDAEPKKKS